MACGATLSLKRSLEFDPLYSPGQMSPKRRRCTPMNVSISPQSSKPAKRSSFQDTAPKLSQEEIAVRIRTEIKRMHRRRQLTASSSSTQANSQSIGDPSQDCQAESVAPRSPSSSTSLQSFLTGSPSSSNASKKDVPLFTFKHLNVICERLLKEREDVIREEYDKVLTCKLAEQYESFLKFNHDQLHRRFNESAASYVS